MIGRRSFPFGKAHFQGRTVSFREGIYIYVILDVLFHYGKYFFCETTHKFDGTFFLWWILFSNCFGATEMNFDRRNPTFQPLHRYTTRCRSLPLEPPEMLMKFWDMKGGHVAFR